MVASITVIIYLPIGLNILVNQSEEQLMERASSTPLIVGAKGSSLDLAINTLYFEPADFDELTMLAVDKIYETGFAVPIPMFIKFKARSFSIIGTDVEYFDFRELEIERGESLAVLGDCVIGFEVSEELADSLDNVVGEENRVIKFVIVVKHCIISLDVFNGLTGFNELVD